MSYGVERRKGRRRRGDKVLFVLLVFGKGQEKTLPSPSLGRERETLRGATQIRARPGRAPSLPSVAGRGPRPSPGPLVAPSSPMPAGGPFQPGGPSLTGGGSGTHAPSWRWRICYPKTGEMSSGNALTGRRGRGWGSCPPANPGRPGPGRGSTARRWPRWWPRGRSAGRTGEGYTSRPCPSRCPGGS